MITYEKTNRMTMVAAVLVLGVAVGGGVWWWQSGQGGDGATGASAEPSKASSAWFKGGSSGDDTQVALNPKLADDGRPTDVQTADWGALNGALTKAGIDAKEGQKIVSFLRFQHTFEAWQNIDETKEPQRRRRVGEALFAEIPDRLRSGEFTPIEANMMGAVLISGIETDEQARAKKLEDWQQHLNTVSPLPTDEAGLQAQFKQTEFSRRLSSAYDDWQKLDQTDANRAPAKLEQAFVEVKRAINAGQ